MILQNLLQSVEFHDLTKWLVAYEEQCKDNLYAFKEAFDLLRLMQPQPSDGIRIKVSTVDYEDGNPPHLSAYLQVCADWEIMLSREVVITDDSTPSKEELAAVLLYEITFYGYSPYAEDYEWFHGNGDAANNPYVAPLAKLRQRNHDINCRDKSLIGTPYYPIGDLWYNNRRNGPKRHRETRQAKRIEYLEKQVKRWNLCERLAAKYDVQDIDSLRKEIMERRAFTLYQLQSRAPLGKEIDYITHLVYSYFPVCKGNGETDAIVFVAAPARIMEDEMIDCIFDCFGSYCKLPHYRIVKAVNNDIENIRIEVIVFKV